MYMFIYIYVTLFLDCNNLQETQQRKHDRNTLLKKTRWDFIAFLAGVLLTLNPEIVKLSPEPWIPSDDSQMFQCVHLSNPKNYSGGIQYRCINVAKAAHATLTICFWIQTGSNTQDLDQARTARSWTCRFTPWDTPSGIISLKKWVS